MSSLKKSARLLSQMNFCNVLEMLGSTAAEIGLRTPTECTFNCENELKNKSGVYFLFCKSNNKIYIGQSKNLLVRLKEHTNSLLKTKHRNVQLQNCFDKYGLESFAYGVIAFTESLDFYETMLISYFAKNNKCLNCDSGGNTNKKVSEETRKKQSESAKKKFTTFVHPMKGKKFDDEYRKKLSDSHIGIPSKKKGVKTGVPAWNSGKKGVQTSTKRRPVSVFDCVKNIELGIFESIVHFREQANYKSKNQKKISETQIRLGRYILTDS